MYPCSTKTREVLENPSPAPKRFPETREISQGRSPREISRAEGMDFPFSHHWQGSIDFNTVRTTRPTGMYFLMKFSPESCLTYIPWEIGYIIVIYSYMIV